jgi:E3 ubiquitin-protein ligase ATL6/9/15/31/42/55
MAKIMLLLLLLLLLVSVMATAQSQALQPAAADGPSDEAPSGVSFRPTVPIAVGIFAMVLSLAFVILMYTKLCHQSSLPPRLPATSSWNHAATAADPVEVHGVEPNGGVEKAVIESLPFFQFAALRGARQGLECAVCLVRFDDADLLRLLPGCRHAFHLECVDRWLGSSASCPLCRARVDADEGDLKYASISARFVFGTDDDHPATAVSSSSVGNDLLQAGIFVERVPSLRFGLGGDNPLDRHRHRIVVSDAVFKSRWSDLNSADLIALDTEMMRSFYSDGFDDDDDIVYVGAQEENGRMVEKKRLLESSSKADLPVRSMSEIVRLPRVAVRTKEERRWLPIARRTARWFARREEEATGHFIF